MLARPRPCQIREIRKPYRTIVSCQCGWLKAVFHRNALARASMAAVGNEHLKGKI